MDLHLFPQIERFRTAAFTSEAVDSSKSSHNRSPQLLRHRFQQTYNKNSVQNDANSSFHNSHKNNNCDKDRGTKDVGDSEELRKSKEQTLGEVVNLKHKGTQDTDAAASEEEQAKPKRRGLEPNPFHPRASTLDLLQEDSSLNASEFRGFFHLVILLMGFYLFTTQGVALVSKGTLIGLHNLKDNFSRLDLVPAWLAQLTFAGTPVLLQKMIVRGWIRPAGVTAVATQVAILTTLFGACTFLAVERRWPLAQTCFFLAEMLLLMMKMHSYIVTNRELAMQYLSHKYEGDTKEVAAVKVSAGAISQVVSNPEGDSQLESPGKHPLVLYPHNVTWGNYLFFLLAPTLVYELNYPRTRRVRVKYLLEKAAGFVGVWNLIHVILNQSVLPVLAQSHRMSMWQSITLLIFPSMITYLLLFFIVFEIICNGFAELTRFADREFYQDWWNSTNFDEFSRKWNRPVHEWLLRHVYLESIKSYKLKKVNAAVLTFLISSILHEYFMGVVLRLFRPYLFFIQMAQLPLIHVGRSLRGKKEGNYLFWAGLLVGPPLLSILYAREYFLSLS